MNKDIKAGQYVFLGKKLPPNTILHPNRCFKILEYPYESSYGLRIRFGEDKGMDLCFDTPHNSDYLTCVIDFSSLSEEEKARYITILNSSDKDSHQYVLEILKRKKNCIII